MIKKISLFLLVIIIALCTICCRGGKPKGNDDETSDKTILKIGNVDGGFGEEWLADVANRFEEFYKDKSFEKDKKGVKIDYHTDHDYHGLTNLSTSMMRGDKDIYFSESVPYNSLIQKRLLLEITDAVENPLTEYGEDKSIQDKVFSQYNKEVVTTDGKYYAVPYNIGNYGIIYNVDLFNDNNLYFGTDNEFVSSLNDKKGNGPDGQPNTFDDGLPATFEQFYKLCEAMREKGITPLCWPGQYLDYINQMLYSLTTDIIGYDKMLDGISQSGNLEIVENPSKDITDSGAKFTNISLDKNNGYQYFLNKGVYYSLKFMQGIIEKKYYTLSSTNNSYSHLNAEKDFIFSGKKIGGTEYEKIGMMINGSWWYNEADDYFKLLKAEKGEEFDKKNFKYGFMSFPKYDITQIGKSSLKDSQKSMCLVSSKIDDTKIECAKAFIRFCHTDESLSKYTLLTNTEKPYEFTITEQDKSNISFYGNTLHNLYQYSDIFVPLSSKSLIYNSQEKYFNEIFLAKGYSEFVEKVFVEKKISVKDYMVKIQEKHSKSNYDLLLGSLLQQ